MVRVQVAPGASGLQTGRLQLEGRYLHYYCVCCALFVTCGLWAVDGRTGGLIPIASGRAYTGADTRT